jgi:hypothetical protein
MKYAERAVNATADYLKANLPAHLRSTEAAQGLKAYSIPDPVQVLKTNAPWDTRSPLLEVFCDNFAIEEQRSQYTACDLTIVLSLVGDADLEKTDAQLYRYSTAITQAVIEDPSLGDTVESALVHNASFTQFRGPQNITRKIAVISAEVKVKER